VRFLLCLVIVCVGCVATLPDDPSLSADIAAETARMVVHMRHEITPTPAPKSDQCDNCEGRGFVGDGNGIKVTCQPCGGTGKRVASVCKDCKP
jgi:hypothetical protein